MQQMSILIKNYTAIFFWAEAKNSATMLGCFLYSSLQFIPAFFKFFYPFLDEHVFIHFLDKFEKGIPMLVLIRKNVCVKS